jgi:hypothetical protein
MSPILGAIGLILAMSGLLSLLGLAEFPLAFIELTGLHTLPLLNVIPPAWLYMLIGALMLLVAGGSPSSGRSGGDYY